jgi:hypothetical protein
MLGFRAFLSKSLKRVSPLPQTIKSIWRLAFITSNDVKDTSGPPKKILTFGKESRRILELECIKSKFHIYPRGDYSVEPNLLAPAFLKASADSDPSIKAKYNIKILNLPASYSGKEIAEQIEAENPYAVGYSVYIWNFDLMHSSSKIHIYTE